MSVSKNSTSIRIGGTARNRIKDAADALGVSMTKALDHLLDQKEMRRRLAVASKEDITGRDGFVVTKALLYAVAVIQFLPEERQEFSDMCDMLRILKATSTNDALGLLAASVIGRTAMPIDFAADVDAERAVA